MPSIWRGRPRRSESAMASERRDRVTVSAPQPGAGHRPGMVARIVASVLLILTVGVALFFGIIMVAIVFGVAIVLLSVLAVRTWWWRRKIGLNMGSRHHESDVGVTVDGEYTVQRSERDTDDRHR